MRTNKRPRHWPGAVMLVFLLFACSAPAASAALPLMRPQPMRLVTLGDSITADYWPWYLGLPIVHNAGIGGNTAAMMLARLASDVLAYSPTDVTVLAGTNDMPAGDLTDLAAIIDGIRAGGARVWLLTIPPRTDAVAGVEAYNAVLPALALAHGARLIDVWPLLAGPGGDWRAGYTIDGVHPSATAAVIIATAVRSALLPPPHWRVGRIGRRR